uniref:Prolactin releasing hormone 2 n=1 Tax=Pundamilia nyererei TaxID=303518 RepID=A0A3B4FVP6_9CICH
IITLIEIICITGLIKLFTTCHLSFFSLLFLHLCCSDPDISASWYTGRGIRPLGRFGRKAARRNELLNWARALSEVLQKLGFNQH